MVFGKRRKAHRSAAKRIFFIPNKALNYEFRGRKSKNYLLILQNQTPHNMNTKFSLISLALALLLTASCCNQKGEAPVNSTDAVLANIHSRKSVRSFTSEPVKMEDLMTIVKAGMAAPTGMNRQPWEFIVVNGRENMDKVVERMGEGRGTKMFKEAQAAIVVLGNPEESHLWYLDCAAATENILLAIESLGLGGVWTCGYPLEDRIKQFTQVFEIPAPFVPLCVIPIGYPNGEQTPKDKWKPEKVKIFGE